MASIRREIPIQANAQSVWSVLRNFDNIHRDIVPGFVVDCRLEDDEYGQARVVTFANGMVARELLVSVDDENRRCVYAIVGGAFAHYNGALQVVSEIDGGCRIIWLIDLLPDSFAEPVRQMVEQGALAMQKKLGETCANATV